MRKTPSSFTSPRAPQQWLTFPLYARRLRMLEPRLNKSSYHRLPHVPASFCCPVARAPHLHVLVRVVVRDEFRVVIAYYYHPFFDATPSDTSLNEPIINELRTTPSTLSKVSLRESHNAAPTDGITFFCGYRQPTPTVAVSYFRSSWKKWKVYILPHHCRYDQSHPSPY